MATPFQQYLLTILAQQPAQQSAPVPANTKTGPTTVAGSPTPFDPFQYFPTIMTGWGANNVAPIRRLSNVLNMAIFVLSNGGLDLNRLRSSNFVVDISKYPDVVLRGLIKYALQVHRLIYSNYGAPYKAVITDKLARVQALKNFLTTFQIPDGSINNFLGSKLGGGLKAIILTTLSLIK